MGWNISNRRRHLEGKVDELKEIIDKHTTFDDTPFNTMKMIHLVKNEYPNAKFVLTERDPYEWIDSMIRWNFDDMAHPMIGSTYTNAGRVKSKLTKMEIDNHKKTSPVYRIYKEELEFFKFKIARMEVLSENKDAWITWRHNRKEYLQDLLGGRLLTLKFSEEKPLTWKPLSEWIHKHNPDIKIRHGELKKYNVNKYKKNKT